MAFQCWNSTIHVFKKETCVTMVIFTLPAGMFLKLFLSLLKWSWLTSLLHPEPSYHLISFIPSPWAHSPVIISPLQLIPQLTPLLLLPSTSHHCGPVSLGSTTWWNENCFQQLFFLLFGCILCSTPLSFPFRKPQPLMELFIKPCEKLLTLTNYDTLGGKHIIKTQRLFT